MSVHLLSEIIFDNTILVAMISLVGGALPGFIAYLSERAKLKRAEAVIVKQEEALKRLETLATQLENTILFLQDLLASRNQSSGAGDSEPEDESVQATIPAQADNIPAPTVPTDDLPRLLTEKTVIWLGQPWLDTPRYALITFSRNDQGVSFKLRDYIGGKLWQHLGDAPGRERNFTLEPQLDYRDVLKKARCHIPARGILGRKVARASAHL